LIAAHICLATETARVTAVARIADKITGMPQVTASAEEVYSLLLHRSGLIREPAEGRVDFVHRTFQEYLTAAKRLSRATSAY
jgi:hypothetical protein